MFHIRKTTTNDVPIILFFIHELAKYEKLAHEVVATEQDLEKTLFGNTPQAEVLLAIADNTPVGFALFFPNYSTFLGRGGIHLEDLFVLKEHRGKGYGKALLKEIANIALSRNAGRLEWNVLDWNTPAIHFYRHIGATPMEEWTTFRLTGEALRKFASSAHKTN